MTGVDERSTPIEIQFLGNRANALLLAGALETLGGLARYERLALSPTTDDAEVGLVVVRDLEERQVIDAVNECLQSLPVGTIGIAFEHPQRRRTLEQHKADLAAWVRPKGFTTRIVIRRSEQSERPHAP